MDKINIAVTRRDLAVKANDLRADSFIPAICYGNGIDPVALQVEYQSFRKIYSKAGENTVVSLEGEGVDVSDVLIHAVQYHPVTNKIIHIDFISIDMKKPVITHVPVKLVGTAPAVLEKGGVLVHHKDQIEVKCLPKDLIHEVDLDISTLLDIHSALHVSDIKLGDKIQILDDMEDMIVNVVAPKVEVESSAEATTETPAEGASTTDAGGEKKE